MHIYIYFFLCVYKCRTFQNEMFNILANSITFQEEIAC